MGRKNAAWEKVGCRMSLVNCPVWLLTVRSALGGGWEVLSEWRASGTGRWGRVRHANFRGRGEAVRWGVETFCAEAAPTAVLEAVRRAVHVHGAQPALDADVARVLHISPSALVAWRAGGGMSSQVRALAVWEILTALVLDGEDPALFLRPLPRPDGSELDGAPGPG